MDHLFDNQKDFAKHLRRALTEAEVMMWELLRNRQRKVEFRRQHPIGSVIVDIYCAEAKLVDGCDGAPHFTDEGRLKDERRTSWLNSQDIEVIRFTSHDIVEETQRVLEAIGRAIEKQLVKRLAPHPPAPSPRSTEEKGSLQYSREVGDKERR